MRTQWMQPDWWPCRQRVILLSYDCLRQCIVLISHGIHPRAFIECSRMSGERLMELFLVTAAVKVKIAKVQKFSTPRAKGSSLLSCQPGQHHMWKNTFPIWTCLLLVIAMVNRILAQPFPHNNHGFTSHSYVIENGLLGREINKPEQQQCLSDINKLDPYGIKYVVLLFKWPLSNKNDSIHTLYICCIYLFSSSMSSVERSNVPKQDVQIGFLLLTFSFLLVSRRPRHNINDVSVYPLNACHSDRNVWCYVRGDALFIYTE